ncbi:sodium:proton exchanger [Natrarchaeobius halalkaliphilus]|uniref:Sodium:proton exchanger n=1 Tax=Natrarchaeobius halalkaliphilus TaxID=1679091 RepID=A0A3N6M950_9EURY|nr:cation:proton antiporter [Natrarchaeobius halalkaliphilus]RQG90016.1 sodium:proton exchanger [Natrarchaeobius halalkaliphilus]
MYDTLFAITAIFVIAAAVLIVVTQRSFPITPFYIVAGILAGLVIDETQLLELAQWGIAFIVFVFGVNVNIGTVRSQGRTSTIIGIVQVSIVGFLGFAAGVGLGLDLENAAFLGIAAGLSSSLIATSYLQDSSRASSASEQLARSIHFVEDILGIIAIIVLSAVVYVSTPSWEPAVAAVGLFALALVVRYALFVRMISPINDDAELLMLVAITFAIGAMAIAEAVGLSIVVGAFAAGIAVVDEYPQSLTLTDTIEDLEDFFAPIFFITLGALLTVPTVESLGLTLVLVLAILVINPLLVAVLLLAREYDGRTAVSTGLSLDHVSVFSLFIAIEALGAEAIDRAVFNAIVLAAVVTMIAAAFTSSRAGQIERTLRKKKFFDRAGETITTNISDEAKLTDHVIIAGSRYGSGGLRDERIDRTLVFVGDDRESITDTTKSYNYIYGAVSNDDVWERAQAENAALIVSLYPDRDRTDAIVDVDVDTPLLVRTNQPDDTDELLEAGAAGSIDSSAVTAEHIIELLENEIPMSDRARGASGDDST